MTRLIRSFSAFFQRNALLLMLAALRLLFGFVLLLRPGDAPAMQGFRLFVLLWAISNTILVGFWFIRTRVQSRARNPLPLTDAVTRTIIPSALADVLVGAVLLLAATPLAFFILTFALYLIAHGFALLVWAISGSRRRQVA